MTLITLQGNDRLLEQLRAKRDALQARIEEYHAIQPSDPAYLFVGGQIVELMTWIAWIDQMIDQLDSEVSE